MGHLHALLPVIDIFLLQTHYCHQEYMITSGKKKRTTPFLLLIKPDLLFFNFSPVAATMFKEVFEKHRDANTALKNKASSGKEEEGEGEKKEDVVSEEKINEEEKKEDAAEAPAQTTALAACNEIQEGAKNEDDAVVSALSDLSVKEGEKSA